MLPYRSCIYKNENTGQQYWSKMQHVEPVPRFAHQLVYDHVRKVGDQSFCVNSVSKSFGLNEPEENCF